MNVCRGVRWTVLAALLIWSAPATADQPMLNEAVDFGGQVLWLELGTPALILAVTQGGDRRIAGFGEAAPGQGAPDGGTLMRVGSITKVFTGAMLAQMTAEGDVNLTDPLTEYLDWPDIDGADGPAIRLIDLATHGAGLPREADREPGPDDDPFATLTETAYRKAISEQPRLFAPGSGISYSNMGFDLLAMTLGQVGGQAYRDLLRTRLLDPIDLKNTVFAPREGDRLMQGHGFQGEALPDIPTTAVMSGASGLYSTADDMLTWLEWHLAEDAGTLPEARLLDHAAWVPRDGRSPVFAMDESGHMDAMGLGWVIMRPDAGRPLILQKAGGLQGMFVYHAFAPAHDIGVFVAINQFDFDASLAIAAFANDLIAQLAGR